MWRSRRYLQTWADFDTLPRSRRKSLGPHRPGRRVYKAAFPTGLLIVDLRHFSNFYHPEVLIVPSALTLHLGVIIVDHDVKKRPN